MSRIVGPTLTNINSLEFYNFDFDVLKILGKGLLKESIKTVGALLASA